jgi:hypothetical protein
LRGCGINRRARKRQHEQRDPNETQSLHGTSPLTSKAPLTFVLLTEGFR